MALPLLLLSPLVRKVVYTGAAAAIVSITLCVLRNISRDEPAEEPKLLPGPEKQEQPS